MLEQEVNIPLGQSGAVNLDFIHPATEQAPWPAEEIDTSDQEGSAVAAVRDDHFRVFRRGSVNIDGFFLPGVVHDGDLMPVAVVDRRGRGWGGVHSTRVKRNLARLTDGPADIAAIRRSIR